MGALAAIPLCKIQDPNDVCEAEDYRKACRRNTETNGSSTAMLLSTTVQAFSYYCTTYLHLAEILQVLYSRK